ncbi:hypothetical protein [Tsukamurella paurometabola]|uniref:Uncharacterized protein n=1 Tax=Tsukamurella paurometabola TaxID=2061 RepID=A0ABS5NEP7_TSUPA|nr:hypothetical protein [Tsukamurella paurometabola]MBS4102764.1 hypothetical protein [Tsukamurella paurometabola]
MDILIGIGFIAAVFVVGGWWGQKESKRIKAERAAAQLEAERAAARPYWQSPRPADPAAAEAQETSLERAVDAAGLEQVMYTTPMKVTRTEQALALETTDPDTYYDWLCTVSLWVSNQGYIAERMRRVEALRRGDETTAFAPSPPGPVVPPDLATPPAPRRGTAPSSSGPSAPSAPSAPTAPGTPKGTDTGQGQFDPKDRGPNQDQFAAKEFNPKDLMPDADGFL